MSSLKGSRTEKNLAASFVGECMARNKYTFYASKAKKQGFEQISAIFLETAENEREHAKRFLKALGKGEDAEVDIQAGVQPFRIGSTLENLKDAANGESHETKELYPQFAAIAEQEGFLEIAQIYRIIAAIEKEHMARFQTLANHIEKGTLFKRNRIVRWKCRNCGYTVDAMEAPIECPSCGHPQGWFEVKEVLD